MTTAREIADWHRAEAKRLNGRNATLFSPDTKPAHRLAAAPFEHNLTDRIKLHERFAAWLFARPVSHEEATAQARRLMALKPKRNRKSGDIIP